MDLYTKKQAASRMALSVRSFERHVQPHLKLVRVGRSVRVPAVEITRWIEEMTRS